MFKLVLSTLTFGFFSLSHASTLEALRAEAFQLCQAPHQPVVIEPVPELDPPKHGAPNEVGLVYQEELSITSKTILDQDAFYFVIKPRAALNQIPMDFFISYDKGQSFQEKTWADVPLDYSSAQIQPPIDKNLLPEAGQVLTELIVGHRSPQGDYPQLFDIRSSGYLRFAGYPPAITGASLRIAAHRIFGTALPENTKHEDFPVLKKIYASIKDSKTAQALVLVDSEGFCGAVAIDMNEGVNADMVLDGYWYAREDFDWKKSPHTAFVAYSSMLWKTEWHTPLIDTDEAHDSDVLRVSYDILPEEFYRLLPPEHGIGVKTFGETVQPTSWTLANEDQDPHHYADFESALGHTNYQWRASYNVEILESSVKTAVAMYEQATGAEYADNLVAASVLRQNIPKAQSLNDFVRFKYRTTAFR